MRKILYAVVCVSIWLTSGATVRANQDIGEFFSRNKGLFSDLPIGSRALDNFEKSEGKRFKCPCQKFESPGKKSQTYQTTECFALFRLALDGERTAFVFKTQDEVAPYLYKIVFIDTAGRVSPDFTLAYEVADPEGGIAPGSNEILRVKARVSRTAQCGVEIHQKVERKSGSTIYRVQTESGAFKPVPVAPDQAKKLSF